MGEMDELISAVISALRPVWQQTDQKAAEIAASLIAKHEAAELHMRIGRIPPVIWCWDSGALGTPLVAEPTRKVGLWTCTYPGVFQKWRISANGTVSAVVDLKMAQPGAALSTAVSICGGVKPTLSSQEYAESGLSLAEVSVPYGARLFALFESFTGSADWLSVEPEIRRA